MQEFYFSNALKPVDYHCFTDLEIYKYAWLTSVPPSTSSPLPVFVVCRMFLGGNLFLSICVGAVPWYAEELKHFSTLNTIYCYVLFSPFTVPTCWFTFMDVIEMHVEKLWAQRGIPSPCCFSFNHENIICHFFYQPAHYSHNWPYLFHPWPSMIADWIKSSRSVTSPPFGSVLE